MSLRDPEALRNCCEALRNRCERLKLEDPLLQWGDKFVELEECSLNYQISFKNAWKAIEHGNLRRLKDSIENMKEYANTHPGDRKYLDVCYLQNEMSLSGRKRTFYFMGLLAYAAVRGRKNMVEELILSKASPEMGDCLSGSPLTQILVYALHHNCSEVINTEIVQLLIGTNLNINILYLICDDSHAWCSPIELAVSIKRMDIAKQLVMAGAHPIHPSLDDACGVLQVLNEFYEFGTNEYISWLLHQHLSLREIPQFIEDVVKLDIFNEAGVRMFDEVGRHPAHALLTCGNEDMVRRLFENHPEIKVNVKDGTGRTALQIATENGDLESVMILLKFYRKLQGSNVSSDDEPLDGRDSNKDMELALLTAARKGDIKIVRCIVEEGLHNVIHIIDQAVEEGLTTLFEVLRDYQYLYALLKRGNTLVHTVALNGNSKLFKMFFPLQPSQKRLESGGHNPSDSHELQKMISSDNARQMFKALTLEDNRKTPLHLAIDNNNICILRTLQERITERDSYPGAEQNIEKNAWNNFWEEWGPKLFVYACSHGSVEAAKFLMELDTKKELLKTANDNDDTPLSAAARSGNDDILQYLLDDCKMNFSLDFPLLLAAENSHAACVSILLKKGADITVTNDYGYNCLMIAAERKYNRTVMVILSDKRGFEALRCRKGSITPMRMLIKYLPDAAEWILNRCVLEKHRVKASSDLTGINVPFEVTGAEAFDGASSLATSIGSELVNEFEFLEDFRSPETDSTEDDDDDVDFGGDSEDGGDRDWRPQNYHSANHTIKLMVKYNREKLLDHILVKTLIKYKWWRVGFPILLFSYGFHLVLLFLLTAFALVLPIAGSSCTSIAMGLANNTTNNTDVTCEGTGKTEGQMRFLVISAVIVMLISIFYLLLEIYQIYQRRFKKYFTDPQNYFQVVTYVCVIIFVFPLGHKCWCYPSWKWQIGALAIFLTWVNNLLLLKHIPHIGKPVTMLFNVYLNFILLIYLPILLILTFAFPFYMLFVATLKENSEMALIHFPTPFHAMWSVIIQTVDGPDTEFLMQSLPHQVMTYTLFITFIVTVLILFNNFLTGMAVGETEAERKKAKLSLIKSKVDYIFESEDIFRRFFHGFKPTLTMDDHKIELLQQQNGIILEELKLEGDVYKKLDKLQNEMTGTAKSFGVLEGEIKKIFTILRDSNAKIQ